MHNAVSINGQEKFDISDFASRWRGARVSALKKNLEPETCKNVLDRAATGLDSLERELLLKVAPEKQQDVLRAVFDQSRILGMSVVRHLGLSWELSDFKEIFPKLGSPCFKGEWRPHNAALVLKRAACSELAALGHFACDYWREAMDGLIVGTGTDERYARHRSAGHGDSECLDILFVEKFSPVRMAASPKFGPVSEALAQSLEPTKQRFQDMKMVLELVGESEGTLFYRLEGEEGAICGAGGKYLHDSFVREVVNLFPNFKVKDVAPIAVLNTGGKT